jgi:hypothetical protein
MIIHDHRYIKLSVSRYIVYIYHISLHFILPVLDARNRSLEVFNFSLSTALALLRLSRFNTMSRRDKFEEQLRALQSDINSLTQKLSTPSIDTG